MRRVKSAVAVLVALVLLSGAAWFGDRWARSEAEDRIEAAIHEQIPELSADLDVTVGGRFVIPQLIGGQVSDVTISTPEATIDGFTITGVTVVASGIPLRGHGSIDEVTATGTAPTQSVIAALRTRVDLPEGVSIELHDGEIAAVASVLGVPLAAYVRPVAHPRSIGFEISRFVLGDAEVDADSIPLDLNALMAGATVDLEVLPDGIELTQLTVTSDGVDVTFEGTGVSL